MRCMVAQYEKLALEIIWLTNMIRTGDKNLFNLRLYAQGCLSDAVRIYRHLPVRKDIKTQFFSCAVEDIPALFAKPEFVRKEYNTHAVSPKRWKVHAKL